MDLNTHPFQRVRVQQSNKDVASSSEQVELYRHTYMCLHDIRKVQLHFTLLYYRVSVTQNSLTFYNCYCTFMCCAFNETEVNINMYLQTEL